jgi:hypothetical protein
MVTDPWIFLVLDNGRAVIYALDPKTKDIDLPSHSSKLEVFILNMELTSGRIHLRECLCWQESGLSISSCNSIGCPCRSKVTETKAS